MEKLKFERNDVVILNDNQQQLIYGGEQLTTALCAYFGLSSWPCVAQWASLGKAVYDVITYNTNLNPVNTSAQAANQNSQDSCATCFANEDGCVIAEVAICANNEAPV